MPFYIPRRPTLLALLLSLLVLSALPVNAAGTRSSSINSKTIGSALKPRWAAAGQRQALSDEDYDCRPFGECEACPPNQLSEPFCQPYGNRRLLHCVPSSLPHHPPSKSSSSSHNSGGSSSSSEQHSQEIPAWEACGKSPSKELKDYWEFVTANVLFFIVSMTVLTLRGRKLANIQYRMLAARIGLPGVMGGGSGGTRFLGFSL